MPPAFPEHDGGIEGTISLLTTSANHTRAVAAMLGSLLCGGEVLGLVGGLGAGKTCFVQGLARGMGVPPEAYVCSPTFALWSQHEGRIPLYHVDLYRLDDPEDAVFIGYEDLFDGVAVVAIEWFERFPELWPADYLMITLDDGPASAAVSESGAGPGRVEIAGCEGVSPSGEDVGQGESTPEDDTQPSTRVLRLRGVGARHQQLARRFHEALRGRSHSSPVELTD